MSTLRTLGIAVGAAFVLTGSLAVLAVLSWRRPALGIVDGRLVPCPDAPCCVTSYPSDAQHQLDPLTFKGPAESALDRLVGVLESMPRTRIVDRQPGYLHAEFTSAFFRFVDDAEFLADADRGRIEFRLSARVGYSDLGVNRGRAETIRKAFEGRSTRT